MHKITEACRDLQVRPFRVSEGLRSAMMLLCSVDDHEKVLPICEKANPAILHSSNELIVIRQRFTEKLRQGVCMCASATHAMFACAMASHIPGTACSRCCLLQVMYACAEPWKLQITAAAVLLLCTTCPCLLCKRGAHWNA